MCYFASYGHVGYQLVAVFTDKEADLTTCLELLLHMPKSVNWPYQPYTKNMLHVCLWGAHLQ